MRVKRDFEALYKANEDPWSIGNASAPRYNRYFEMVQPYANGKVLDIGSGSGAFLARLKSASSSLHAVDISAKAVEIGRKRYSFIQFYEGAADRLNEVEELGNEKFDLIICSDVICYLGHRGRRRLLEWISSHLGPTGIALVAAWVPGRRYLSRIELDDLIVRTFVVVDRVFLEESGHLACVCRNREILVSLTIDYETWHPIPQGKSIDWERDVLAPTESLAKAVVDAGVPLTFFVEMGEYFWLFDNEPTVAACMREQWCRLAAAGHDIQLHLHPCWLPELGARRSGKDWHWDWSKARIHDYPGDVAALIRKCVDTLEEAVKSVRPEYRVSVYRAGAYQAQPFARLYSALRDNGIVADSSVFPSAISEERGYDYSLAYSSHQPYFASPLDPQLLAPPSERNLVELPVFSFAPGRRAGLDGQDGSEFAQLIVRNESKYRRIHPPELQRIRNLVRRIAQEIYNRTSSFRRLVNFLLPRTVAHWLMDYPDPSWEGDRFYVLLGHTKAEHRLEDIRSGIAQLRSFPGLRFVTMAHAAMVASGALRESHRPRAEERAFQVDRETSAVLGDQRNLAQSAALQETIPLDRDSILDFGCGAGYWSERIAALLPWSRVVGIDAGPAFLQKAHRNRGRQTSFICADFLATPFATGLFDCVYADNTLEHAFDVDKTLSEIRRVMSDDGILVAGIPSDARNPRRTCDNHTWKTHPGDVIARLERAGFFGITVSELDTFRDLGMAPFPPSRDRLILVRAWASNEASDPVRRAIRAMDWIYKRVRPTRSNLSQNAMEIIRSGESFCMGYAVALGQLLRSEGYDVQWITMEAIGHERGRGPSRLDTHEIVAIAVDGRSVLLDPTTNTVFSHSIDELLREPSLADKSANRDERCAAHGFSLYNTSYWYSRVARYARRPTLAERDIRWITLRNP